jgi:hypothetical protein
MEEREMTTETMARLAERLSDLSVRVERLEEAFFFLFGPHPTVSERLADLGERESA